MTDTECLKEVKKLEASLLRFPPRTADDVEFWNRRRAAIWEAVEKFDIGTLRQAFKRFYKAGEAYGFPTVPEIVQECESVMDGEEVIERKKVYPRLNHTCAEEKPQSSPALMLLKALWPYEAEHILCSVEIPATCPECGALHIELGTFDSIIEENPDQTAGWTRNFKGWILCAKCAKKER